MQNKAYNPIQLDDATAKFVCSQVTINIATTNESNMAIVARAYGCRVAPDRRCLVLIVNRAHNEELLKNIEHNHRIAVAFSRPSTHQTVQLKSFDAQVVGLTSEDVEVHENYKRVIAAELQSVGFAFSFAEAVMNSIDNNSVGIRFSPHVAFTQTPGPDAGKKIII